ncbi:hypothetical protein FQN60_006538 [Etheostoma spectabile]|uniref:Uncharacterized protein n=1 Tax=Etheostoma spectabile TaxID=54343 RepID=A0A5J5CEB0_9PERO|nr:hypothetical protein FQN60_006538 [Etheostoma spectabile]
MARMSSRTCAGWKETRMQSGERKGVRRWRKERNDIWRPSPQRRRLGSRLLCRASAGPAEEEEKKKKKTHIASEWVEEVEEVEGGRRANRQTAEADTPPPPPPPPPAFRGKMIP